MLRRILGEVLVGFLIAGIALAVIVPAAARLGYTTSATYGLVIALVAPSPSPSSSANDA